MRRLHTLGSIHGRFQPFHNGHALYLDEALKKCQFLIIGITQFDIKDLSDSPEDTHRAEAENNPLTYQQRCDIIQAYLDEKKISRHSYKFTPFPIDEPHKLKDFIPQATVCYTTAHTPWNLHKIATLQQNGFEVEILLNPDESSTSSLSATEIRKKIRINDDGWKTLVPAACVDQITSSDVLNAIKNKI